ncbi:nucleoside recognition family protein [[Clostridium] bifermentans ATCC 638]|uniref:Nucleoside recognition family protein n=1 Tax=Paraclostridium bifermentans ATCC 638 = DSM 14991 TaxID=1233171 RepID=T4VMD3_PARBF|nr:YjiH family protein [Paraclostridium bifermentans]EQK42285.1 nucleoside recognition family protein [[Clostridium] bifermentans ATCC 638] [Paraclostridium bifermentans ATCC 638 = DSM 14991]RIZ59820.1 transporter [Paraclostridium bifermentans]UAG19139.1 YjiH family protein [Paraclostridium bifermentans]
MSKNLQRASITPDNLNDSGFIDSLKLTKDERKIGTVKFLIFSVIAIMIFFIPIEQNGKHNILFGIIYNAIVDFLGVPGFWYVAILITGNAICSVYGKYIARPGNKLYEYYKSDSKIHPILYLMAAIFMLMYCLKITIPNMNLPQIIVGNDIGGVVIPDIVIGVAWIIPVGAFFVPFLLNYGSIDFFGVLLEPLMRPLFKVPGKSAVDATASFVGSTSMSIIITSRLFKNTTYTKKEATIIATSFSAVSVGYAFVVMKTASIEQYFLPVYFTSFLLAFIVAFFVVRIPPINKMESVYINGRKQSIEDIKNEPKYGKGMIKKGVDRATKRAYYSESLFKSIKDSLVDGFKVLPKVVSLLCAIGILSMIIAKHTPVFEWLGYLFLPILKICQVPDANAISACMPVGITEMFIPTLIIADQANVISEAARAFVVMVSTVQVIFFAESIVVMKSTGIPVNLKQLIILFIERTIIAIPFAAVFVKILF